MAWRRVGHRPTTVCLRVRAGQSEDDGAKVVVTRRDCFSPTVRNGFHKAIMVVRWTATVVTIMTRGGMSP
jgi:hypothetical protein